MQVVRSRDQPHRISLGPAVVQAAGTATAPGGATGSACYRRTVGQPVLKTTITRASTAGASTTAAATLPQAPQALQRATSTPRAVQQVSTPREDNVKFVAQEGPSPLPSAWLDDFEVSEEAPILGGGAFAEVFQVRHRRTSQYFAVKVMHRPNFTLRGIERQIDAEIRAMHLAALEANETKLENHVVRLLQVAEEGEYVFIMLELCSQGDLLRMLYHQPNGRFTEDVAAEWARQLLQGLFTLHKLGVIHRDIKPDNLLCTGQGVLKIADFGWCAEISEAPTVLAGTFQYMAPEVLQNLPQTEKADVWSAGVTLYQLVVGRPLLMTYLGPGATNLTHQDPHEATAVKQRWLVEEIFATCPPSHDLRPQDVSTVCWDFLRMLLVPEAEKRISVEDALWHPWLDNQQRDAVAQEGDVESKNLSRAEQTGVSGHDSARLMVTELSPAPHKHTGSNADLRSPFSDRTSTSESCVPTPQHPRAWDPDRNDAYSPPVDNKENLENSRGRSRSRSRSPNYDCRKDSPRLRSPESQGSTPLCRGGSLLSPEHETPGALCKKALATEQPQKNPKLDASFLQRLMATPTPCRAMAVPAQASQTQRDSSANRRQPKASPVTPIRTSQLSTAATAEPAQTTAEPARTASAANARPSPWSPSPARLRGTSVGPTGSSGPRPAPRLRLSAPGNLVESTQQAGTVGLPLGTTFGNQRGAPPPRSGTTGPVLGAAGYPGRSPGAFESCRSLRLRQRSPTEDTNAIVNDLRNSNFILRSQLQELRDKMKSKVQPSAPSTVTPRPDEQTSEELTALKDHALRPVNGAASVPLASSVAGSEDPDAAPEQVVETLRFTSSQKDVHSGIDLLSATAPAQHSGRENVPPSNIMAGKAAGWSGANIAGKAFQKPGTVQVRSAALARFAGGASISGQGPRLDVLSQTVHTVSMPAASAGSSGMPLASCTIGSTSSAGTGRECNTPGMPGASWPRAVSPEARSMTSRATSQPQAQSSKTQTVKTALPPKAPLMPSAQGQPLQTLPPPRLAVSQPQQRTGVPQRIVTALPVGVSPVWGYAGVVPGASAQNTYRAGPDERRRQSVPSSWFKRA